MRQLKKILIISYSFPPDSGPGVYRTKGLVRYLPENGWHPTVITVPENSYLLTDNSLMADIPVGVRVIRAPYWGANAQKIIAAKRNVLKKSLQGGGSKKTDILRRGAFFFADALVRWASIPDNMNRWIFNAYVAGSKVIKDEKIDLIWSTSPVCSAHLVGLLLKNKYRVPWVADFRDPWTSSFSEHGFFWRRINEHLEKKVINGANRIVTVANGLKKDLLDRHPGLDEGKISVITNGFESSDDHGPVKKSDKLVITHTGSFYGKRMPLSFLRAIKELIAENREIQEKLKIKFVGNSDIGLADKISKIGLGGNLEIISQVAHRECVRLQREADVLLLIPGYKTLSMPGKIFEYLAAKRPILALEENDSDSAALIRETKSGLVVAPDDVPAIKKAVKDIFSDYVSGKLGLAAGVKIDGYSRRNLTKKMAALFDSLA